MKPYACARRVVVFLAGLAFLCVALETGLRVLGLVYRKNSCDFATDTRVPAKDDFFVLCLGDSRTYGLGAPPDKSYPRQLEEKLNRISDRHAIVINDGYAGDNTWQMREKLFKRLSSSARLPDLVILMGGHANFWNFTGAADVTPSLSSFLRRHSRVFRLADLLAENIRKTASAKRQSFLRSKLFITQFKADIKTILGRMPENIKLPQPKTDVATSIEPPDIGYWMGRIADKPIEQIPLPLYRLCAENALALIMSSPDNQDPIRCARLLLGLGNAYRIAGQFDMAALYCLEALKHRPNDSDIYQELSMILFKQDDVDMALRFSLRRLCLCPTEDLFLISQIILNPERLRLLQDTIARFSLPISDELAAIVDTDNPRQQVRDWIRSDLHKMCSALKARKIPVFFLGDFNATPGKPFWKIINGLSQEFNAPYILTATMFPENFNLEDHLAGDHDHPNAKGYGFIADCIIQEIIKQGLISLR